MRHTVVISDVHLCEVEPSDGLWMRYRQKEYAPSREIAKMVEVLRDDVSRPGHHLTFVLNGDVFDLDAPRVVNQESVFHNLPRTAEHAVPAISAILDDHAEFVTSMGKLLADGHTVVFVSGNHDIQVTLPEVRALITERLSAAANRITTHYEHGDEHADETKSSASVAKRIHFRAWFHRTADGIHIEHGNQYDPYCSYRYPMAPFRHESREIQPTMGSLATRLLVSRMGYFNPHVDSSFMLSLWGYIQHWGRYYLFSRRSLAFAWASGAIRTIVELVRWRDPGSRERRRANIAACARETGARLRSVARHARLFSRPAEDKLRLVIRELWLDRITMGFVSLLIALLWVAWAPGALALGALASPAAVVVYEFLVPKPTLAHTWRRLSRIARRVARVHRARAVVFGHTHHPEGSWEKGVFFGNTGSWSAAFRDLECKEPVSEERPLVWLKSDEDGGPLAGGLVAWNDGRFHTHAPR